MNTIYYFTGTGNSLQIANDLSAELEECKVLKIAEYAGERISGKTLGIVFPVYMWGIPLIIADFLEKMEVSENTYIYAVANYGGLPGKALDQCEEIMEKRNITLAAGFLIRMPGNYIIGYGARSEKEQRKLFAKESRKVRLVADYIKTGKVSEIEKSHAILDRVFSDHFYKMISGFHEADRNYTVDDNCNGCGLCAKKCPVHNITMTMGKPTWNHHCELCMACIQSCPNKAIDYDGKTQNRKKYLNPNVKC